MKECEIRRVLERVRDDILSKRNKHTQHRHYRDVTGKALKPIPASLSRVSTSCVGGAVITSLYLEEHIDKYTGRDSKEYCAVMCTLADTLKVKGTPRQKISAVRKYNNEQTYRAVMKLVRDTIKRLPST